MILNCFSGQLSAFDKLIRPPVTAIDIPSAGGKQRGLSSGELRIKQDRKVEKVHRDLLMHMDCLIDLCILEDDTDPDTHESDAIFAEIGQLVADSLLPKQFKNVIAVDLSNAQLAYSAEAFKGCVVMLGAALEGVMLGTLQRDDVIEHLSTLSSSPGPIQNLGTQNPALANKIGNELSFEDYKVCIHELVAGSDALGVDNIQAFRNAIHPWKSIKEPVKYSDFDRARALHYVGSLKKIVEAVCRWTP
jgi:hypothetical protein